MRAYMTIHTRGLGTPTASQHNIFDSGGKNSHFSCAPDGVRTSPGSSDLESDARPFDPTRQSLSVFIQSMASVMASGDYGGEEAFGQL